MIHSGITENWHRVMVLHRIAKDHYLQTAGTEFRTRFIGPGEVFPYDVSEADCIATESAIVGLIAAWSVILLESLVNHRLADKIEDRDQASQAIEYPAKWFGKRDGSDLKMKLAILCDGNRDDKIAKIAQMLSDKRNSIVHDKPIELTNLGEKGEDGVDFHSFALRIADSIPPKYFDHLGEFYADCATVFEFVQGASDGRIVCDVDFKPLIRDCGLSVSNIKSER